MTRPEASGGSQEAFLEFSVIGVGRVGSYAAAKAAHRSRRHRYWAIAKRSDACTTLCRGEGPSHSHYPKGPVEDPRFPHFRTKQEACAHLVEWANNHLPGGPFEIHGNRLEPAAHEEGEDV